MEKHIGTIRRIDHRIMTVTLQHEDALTPITIITSYAPHKGYNSTERKKHWGKLEQTILEVPKRHMQIWCTDANGQLSGNKPDPLYKHIVGPYTKTKETEKATGKDYTSCVKQTT